jgi:CRISPR-associated exonuclease Cas4
MTQLAFTILIVAVILYLLSQKLRTSGGIPEGEVVYSDTSAWQRTEYTFVSHKYGITGKPDYLINDGINIVPIEVKSSHVSQHGKPYIGHIMQLAAYCLLVHDHFGLRPTYGIINYADAQFKIDFTPELESSVIRIINEMGSMIYSEDVKRNHTAPSRCMACGVRYACDQAMK